MTTATLASDSTFPLLRSLETRLARFRYRYAPSETNRVEPVAVASAFPVVRELYDLSWITRHLPLVLAAELNRRVKHPYLAILDRVKDADSLDAYAKIAAFYHPIPRDSLAHEDDGYFAHRRVAGACPLVIERLVDLASLTARMPALDDATFQTVTGASETLATAIANQRLFVVDYARLAQALRPVHAPPGNHDSRFRGKYLPAPVLVLYERPASGTTPADLVPVAITADQPTSDPAWNPLLTPRDGEAWQIAKTYVEVADNNWHFGIGHLWRCHFLMEAFAMATRRTLSRRHPIRMLLDPHVRFTLITNVVAYRYFAKSGLLYDTMYAGSLEESRAMLRASSIARANVLDHLPSRDLVARHLTTGLARYPWRQDALAWETLVRDYVRGVVHAYYADDAAVAADREIAAFAADLTSPLGGNLAGLFPALDRASLVEALTLAVYTGGPGHSAMHFPMYDLYTYAPTACESAFAPPLANPGEGTPLRFKKTLPSIAAAIENFYQVEIGHFRYDVFGDFRGYRIGRLDRAATALAKLRSDLAALATAIDVRERVAPPRRGYPYLHPALVTNSVNI